MVFSSAIFLFVFLPISLLLYFVTPFRSVRNVVLLLVSLVFYAWGEPVYIALMVLSILVNWGCGLAISDRESPLRRKLWLLVALIINLIILTFFKYEGFLADTINNIVQQNLIPNLSLPLPIGISFYTLQAISYLIDVYRKQVEPQKNMLYLGMYIAMFPQLVAGPIVRYSTIASQILHRKENLTDFASGFRLFSIGLAKKALLANTVALMADLALANGPSAIGAVGAWAGLIAYTFQIFFDFSGYSDMAIGLGKMFGFKYLRNFNYPYISKNVTEFWRRWHISLSSFFRDYVYIPLGGNRVKKARWLLNLGIVWLLTGIWHGAAWNFALWGMYYGAVLIVEKLWLEKHLTRLPKVLQHFYAIIAFLFGWLIFWIEDPTVFAGYLFALLGGFGATGDSTLWELTAWQYWPIFIICALASTPLLPWIRFKVVNWACSRQGDCFLQNDIANPKHLAVEDLCNTAAWLDEYERNGDRHSKRRVLLLSFCLLVDIGCLVLLALSISSVVAGTFNPFIYFRF